MKIIQKALVITLIGLSLVSIKASAVSDLPPSSDISYQPISAYPEQISLSRSADQGDGYYQLDQALQCTYQMDPSLENLNISPPALQKSIPPNTENRVLLEEEQLVVYLPAIVKNSCGFGYEDNFSDPQSGWPIYEDNDFLLDYMNGEYRILSKTRNQIVAASPGFQADNFIANVSVHNAGSTYGTYGIMFNIAEDWSHFYSFVIDPEGYFGIWRYSNTLGWQLLFVNKSPYITTGTATNKLTIRREGTLIEVYANDQLMASLSDGSFVGKHYLGLVTTSYEQGNLDIHFDDFSSTITGCESTTSLSAQAAYHLMPVERIISLQDAATKSD